MDIRGVRPNAQARATPWTSMDELTRPTASERRHPTTTRPGRRTDAVRPPQPKRRRRTDRQAAQITVTGRPKPEPDLDLLARALMNIARHLADAAATEGTRE